METFKGIDMDISDLVYRLYLQQTGNISLTELLIMALVSIYLLLLCCYLIKRFTGKRISVGKIILLGLILVYLCFLLQITILSREAGSRSSDRNTFDFDFSFKKLVAIISLMINPDSFDTGSYGWFSAQQFIYDVFNVILFIPGGMLLTALLRKSFWIKRVVMSVCYSFLTTLVIECVQWKLGRGYFEVRDIWLNTLGGLLGSVLVSIMIGLVSLVKCLYLRKGIEDKLGGKNVWRKESREKR